MHDYTALEPEIAVNGQPLTADQATAVRVALVVLSIQLADAEFARSVGPVAAAYASRLREVFGLMHRPVAGGLAS